MLLSGLLPEVTLLAAAQRQLGPASRMTQLAVAVGCCLLQELRTWRRQVLPLLSTPLLQLQQLVPSGGKRCGVRKALLSQAWLDPEQMLLPSLQMELHSLRSGCWLQPKSRGKAASPGLGPWAAPQAASHDLIVMLPPAAMPPSLLLQQLLFALLPQAAAAGELRAAGTPAGAGGRKALL